MIEQCIYEVYKRDKKVFIPDFGAIIYSQYDDSVDFNGLLDFDDGKVVAEIMRQQFLSEEDARKELELYLKDVKSSIEKGKSVFFGGIGYLSREGDGTISLQKAKSTYKSRKRKKPVEPEEEVPTPEEDTGAVDSDLLLSDRNDTVSHRDENDALVADFPYKADDGEHLLNEGDGRKEPGYSWSDDDPHSALVSEDDGDPYDEEAETEQAASKRKRALKAVVLWFIPLALLAFGAYYTLDRDLVAEAEDDQGSRDARADAQTVSAKTVALTDHAPGVAGMEVVDRDDQPTEGEAPEPKPEPKPSLATTPQRADETTNDDNTAYSLILGSFKIERNADNYQQLLQSQGIEVVKFQGMNDFYFVGYENIAGRSTALKRLNEVKVENPSAWIINRERLNL